MSIQGCPWISRSKSIDSWPMQSPSSQPPRTHRKHAMEDHFLRSKPPSQRWNRNKNPEPTIFCPSSSFVPRSRTTTGTFIFKSWKAKIIPSAIISQRVKPPNILTKMAFTRVSEQMTRNDDLTVSDVALPPVSRKLAHRPPWMVSASTVFMARPAPLTAMG